MKSIGLLKKQAGLAITDLLIWGAGIILVIGIIAGFAGLATDSGNTIDYATGLNNIKICAVKTFQGNPDKSDINAINLTDVKCIPSGWVDDASGNIVTPEGGIVAIRAASIGNGVNNGFAMTVPDISSAVCNGVVPPLSANYVEILVDGTVVKRAGETNVDTQSLVDACDKAVNSLELRFIN